jgi:ribosome-binding ATPase YchF (GTP1/OBG family)
VLFVEEHVGRALSRRYDDVVAAGSLKGAKDAGMLRTEGKDYVVQEGDVFDFKFR